MQSERFFRLKAALPVYNALTTITEAHAFGVILRTLLKLVAVQWV
jgi:hypothetical protein